MMKIVSAKHFIASTVLVSALASHSASAILINSPAELTGTQAEDVSIGSIENISVGVGYVRRWTTTTKECKKFFGIKISCKTKTHHHSSNEIQSSATTYELDFGDKSQIITITVPTGGYFNDGHDNLLVNLPVITKKGGYANSGTYDASLTIKDSNGQEDSRNIVVMVRPSEILSSNVDVCDPTKATLVSASSGLWQTSSPSNFNLFWNPKRNPKPDDIVIIRSGHEIALPKDDPDTSINEAEISIKGLCIEGALKTQMNNSGTAPNHVVITAQKIHNNGGTIRTEDGTDATVGTNLDHATAGSSISLFAGRFINDGNIMATGKGGNDNMLVSDIADVLKDNGIDALNALGGDGGHIGIFPNEFTNTGSLVAGNGGDADLFSNWANYFEGSAYGGRGGSVIVHSTVESSVGSGELKAGCGGYAEAVGTQLAKVKGKQSGWFSSASVTAIFTDKLYDVVGGTGGNISINLKDASDLDMKGCPGKTINQVKILPTQYIKLDPTRIEVDENTRLVNANHIYIYGPDDAEIDLTKLSPNSVQANKTVTLSVGENGTIDLRGLSDNVFQAAEKVEVYADEVLLDDGVTLEDLADAPEVTVNPSKILRFVDWYYQSQAKGEPGKILPVQLTLLNSGTDKDSYTIEAQDSKGWLLPPYPTEVSAYGLQRSELFVNVKLPANGHEETELVVTATSKSDPTVQKEARIRVSLQHPEKITPRDGRQADVAIVLDANFRMGAKLQGIADSLVNMMVANGPVSPSDEQMVEWVNQFDKNKPPTKEEYLKFIQGFQPVNPPPPPVIELITFTDTAMTRVVTDNVSDVIGRIRALQTSEDSSCDLASVDAVEYAATNLKEEGHLFLAVASTPSKDMSAAIQQLRDKKIKAHVLLAENCDGSAETALAYQNLSEETGGIFRLTTEDEAGDLAVLEDLLELIMSMGEYTVLGTIRNEAGEPIEGVLVEINSKTTTTDAAGNWEIADFMEGKYTLQVSKEGYVFAPQIEEVGNELYLHQVEIKPLSSLKLIAIPDTWEDIRQGEDLTYTFTIVNGGAQTATGVTLTDVLPTGTTAIAMEALFGGSCDLKTLTCQLPDLNSGASATVELTIHNEQPANLKNVATLTSNEYPADIQKSYKVVKPHLSVALTDSPDPVVMRSALHYQVGVELSPLAPETTATGVELFLRLPEGTELTGITTDYGICDVSEYPSITCELADLSIATPDDTVSHIVVSVDVELTDATLLVLTHEARVAAANYPAHSVRERTNVFVPPEAMADIILVMDTTHSMSEEVNGVIKALQTFIEEQINADPPPVVSVIEFKDNVTLRAFTNDMQQVLDTVNQFQVAEGGFCQEASAEALGLAIDHTVQGGVIFLITDASPYEDADLGILTKRLRDKQIRFSTLISGDCTTSSGKNSWGK
ncbi:carboxypeptidase regulatory-like domain-containing protein [Candidatus Parabeggiatoa sp. HSG14]|uniref:carboxypeptidase regulatory-like domain-containing protein n=1 Tax=Candidatus Parabeggiatoa sp. HSG14 TaxID=3055593 RepID=UPI0025A8F5D3|nr:carboxypeptidase regulatory-like domain-containing protein [Thiotrichales bacterium HSG14]